MTKNQKMHRDMKVVGAPGRYIQGPQIIKMTGYYINVLGFGDNIFFIVDERAFLIIQKDLLESIREHKFKYNLEFFHGECSQKEIERLSTILKDNNSNLVIGVGGGKALDTSKAVARMNGLPLILLPTIASTDAPCSALSVLYYDEGIFNKVIHHSKSPDLVLVDSQVISKAPVRYLVAGMADALSTGYEAEACYKGQSINSFKGKSLISIIHLAKFCSELILKYGVKAKRAVEKGLLTQDVERIIEANIYMSGIGFESGGVAAAHAIASGLTINKKTQKYYHGEKVAFGLLTQFILEEESTKLIRKILNFYNNVDLPMCLKQLGIQNYDKKDIFKIAEKACSPEEPIYNMPFNIDVTKVCDAIIMADSIGFNYLNGKL